MTQEIRQGGKSQGNCRRQRHDTRTGDMSSGKSWRQEQETRTGEDAVETKINEVARAGARATPAHTVASQA